MRTGMTQAAPLVAGIPSYLLTPDLPQTPGSQRAGHPQVTRRLVPGPAARLRTGVPARGGY